MNNDNTIRAFIILLICFLIMTQNIALSLFLASVLVLIVIFFINDDEL